MLRVTLVHLLHVCYGVVIRKIQLKPLQQPGSSTVSAGGIEYVLSNQVKHVHHDGSVLPKNEEGAAGKPLEFDVLLCTEVRCEKIMVLVRPATLLVRPPMATTICSHNFIGGANGFGSLPRMYSKSM